tara:strand:- start:11344 stop:11736 length:393 start_codon:yes stop_codon:yes gene_type:complete
MNKLRPLWRAFNLHCPACGKGKLYRRYLKPVEVCASCGEPIGLIRAEDGPAAWTILGLGPFLVPIAFMVSMSGAPVWLSLPILLLAAIGVVLVTLPRVKGVFIAVLWNMGNREIAASTTREPDDETDDEH